MNNSITTVDGKFYKKCKVVMLPTEKATRGRILKDMVMGGFRVNNDKDGYQYNPKNFIAQHLYILSDEEIKVGDYFMNNYQEEIFKCADKEHKQTLFATKEYGWKKIIATTDPELIVTKSHFSSKQHSIEYHKEKIPRPSDPFLKAYCEKGGIDEVLVEYKKNISSACQCDSFEKISQCPYACNGGEECKRKFEDGKFWYIDYSLKVAPDNTITIKPVKESWNRKEVEQIVRRAIKESKEQYSYFDRMGIDKWIEENL